MDLSKGLPIDNYAKFAATQAGRDKIYRFFQYVARYVAARTSGEEAARYQKISAALGLARRLFRFGKPIEDLNAAMKALAIADPVLKLLTSSRHLLLALWLSVDAVQWLQTVGFISLFDPKLLDKKAAQFWLTSLIISSLTNLYKLQQNATKLTLVKRSIQKDADSAALKADHQKLLAERSALHLDTFRDAVDLILPGSALEYIPMETGRVGVAGALTSAIQGYQLWPKSA